VFGTVPLALGDLDYGDHELAAAVVGQDGVVLG
jgi:hypothetical protein